MKSNVGWSLLKIIVILMIMLLIHTHFIYNQMRYLIEEVCNRSNGSKRTTDTQTNLSLEYPVHLNTKTTQYKSKSPANQSIINGLKGNVKSFFTLSAKADSVKKHYCLPSSHLLKERERERGRRSHYLIDN
jgi:hypothetical protein